MMATERLGRALVSAVGVAIAVGYLHLDAAGLPGGRVPPPGRPSSRRRQRRQSPPNGPIWIGIV